MSQEETNKALWGELKEIRKQQYNDSQAISNIATLLRERCDDRRKACGNKIDNVNAVVKEVKNSIENHNERIYALEQWRWKIYGVAASIGIVAGTASTVLSHVLFAAKLWG